MATVAEIEAWLGRSLPEPNRTFLAQTPDSFLAENDITLVDGIDEIIERNETFESQKYCPGNPLIGDDSGGTAVVLSLDDGQIHTVGQGVTTPDSFEPIAASFTAWAKASYPSRRVVFCDLLTSPRAM